MIELLWFGGREDERKDRMWEEVKNAEVSWGSAWGGDWSFSSCGGTAAQSFSLVPVLSGTPGRKLCP